MGCKENAVVVTGAANGIGREMALAFARRGAPLAIVDIDGMVCRMCGMSERSGEE